MPVPLAPKSDSPQPKAACSREETRRSSVTGSREIGVNPPRLHVGQALYGVQRDESLAECQQALGFTSDRTGPSAPHTSISDYAR